MASFPGSNQETALGPLGKAIFQFVRYTGTALIVIDHYTDAMFSANDFGF